MANDRLYIVCKNCGASKMIAKFWVDSLDVSRWLKPEELDQFMNEHLFDCAGGWLEDAFTLCTEATVPPEPKQGL